MPPTDHGKNGCDNSTECDASRPQHTGSCTWCNGDLHSGGRPDHRGWNNTYYADTAIATDALGRLALATAPNQSLPWFLAVGFRDPHLPWRYPGRFGEAYPARVPSTNRSQIPTDTPPMAWQYPLYFNGNYGNFWELDSAEHMQLTDEEVAEGTRAYYATISFTDSEIGRVLDAARATGGWDDMLVVLWSDHGQNVGEHATWCKMAVWEHSLRVALLIKPPSTGPQAVPPSAFAGQTYRSPVELLDLYKTMAELAGLSAPQKGVEGDSLVAAFRAPTVSIKPFAISQTTRCHLDREGMSGHQWVEPETAAKFYAACVRVQRDSFGYMGYSLRTVGYRYTGWFAWLNVTSTGGPGPDLASGPAGEELYDHRNDTAHFDVDNFEYVNLVHDDAFASTAQELRELLIKTVGSWQTPAAVKMDDDEASPAAPQLSYVSWG